jgi:biotin carboxyl carrier protein
MKLQATVANHEAVVRIKDDGERVSADIDGRHYDLRVQETAPGSYLLMSEGRVFDCHVAGQPECGQAVDVVVGTTRFAVTLTDPKRLRGASNAGAHPDGAARIKAQMPGKVVRVLVEVGAAVEFGAGLVVVEAMKMQNEIKSPKAGVVSALNVEVGATVNAGDVLAVIE